MKLLVTGANGFTGRHFVKIAQSLGFNVIALQTDLTNHHALKSEIAQINPETVVHLAAISYVGHADESAFYQVNVIGTFNLLEALAALPRKPKSILLASSANVYGNCNRSPIPEDQSPSPVNHYGVSKIAMENMGRCFLDKLPIIFVRPFNYTGPGQAESFLIPKLIAHFARKAKVVELGNLDVEREFNDVRFVCEAYLRLLNFGKTGEVYNVCSGNPVALKTVIEMLYKISNYSIEILVNPACIRTNEVHRLCGDPRKLMRVVGKLSMPRLENTLDWMLESYSALMT